MYMNLKMQLKCHNTIQSKDIIASYRNKLNSVSSTNAI